MPDTIRPSAKEWAPRNNLVAGRAVVTHLALIAIGIGAGIECAFANETVRGATEEKERSVAKLPTNETTRAAMSAIRSIVMMNHSLVTHRRMPVSAAHQFERDINAQSKRIRASRMSGAARTKLETILDQIETGAGAVAKTSQEMTPIEGILVIDEALTRYGHAFDHPGWKGLQEF